MGRKEELMQQIKDLEDQISPLESELRDIRKEEEDQTNAKIERCRRKQDKFLPSELIFSAVARCSCGAGMAYPPGIGRHGSWECSAILMGEAIAKGEDGAKEHDRPLPFAFYEIKSENQPSANGRTTRPENAR